MTNQHVHFEPRAIQTLERLVREPTARMNERTIQGVVDLVTNPDNPPCCLAAQSLLAWRCLGEPPHQELVERRAAAEVAVRDRFERTVSEEDLPPDADPGALVRFVLTVTWPIWASSKWSQSYRNPTSCSDGTASLSNIKYRLSANDQTQRKRELQETFYDQ
ncbi:hypothetical protein PGN35_017250 [Nodosilinea sp. PGN35]|uniref:hypothetical protein n=1 Tax=Nodosilinea sp. PGN35 TaxID=3020489 RepID=UPI0023B27456|nr:hypothetical protein [Nodosilinea sp. TSF1-S3]MDF0369587.1 hypothetical protein [Nodosilinea sp. TSF1-S3]